MTIRPDAVGVFVVSASTPLLGGDGTAVLFKEGGPAKLGEGFIGMWSGGVGL